MHKMEVRLVSIERFQVSYSAFSLIVSACALIMSQMVLWTLCGIATLFLASRCAVRMSTKGRLIFNDYFVLTALPALYIGAGLLQSSLSTLYSADYSTLPADPIFHSTAPRITGSIEMLWITIYCVKFCFIAQFKLYKPPYAYVSFHITRHYLASIGLCTASFLFTLAQPIVLCSTSGKFIPFFHEGWHNLYPPRNVPIFPVHKHGGMGDIGNNSWHCYWFIGYNICSLPSRFDNNSFH